MKTFLYCSKIKTLSNLKISSLKFLFSWPLELQFYVLQARFSLNFVNVVWSTIFIVQAKCGYFYLELILSNVLDKTLKGIRGVWLDNRKVLCAHIDWFPRTKYFERLFCRSIWNFTIKTLFSILRFKLFWVYNTVFYLVALIE